MTPNSNNGLGGNHLQQHPDLTSAVSSGGTTTIRGTLIALSPSNYTLDFYSNQSCDPSGFGEGENYLGSLNLNNNATGIISFTANLPVAVPIGQSITATATDALGNTSEFSQCQTVAPSIVAIGGSIKDSNNVPLAKVMVNLTGTRTVSVLTSTSGSYNFQNLPGGGNYTVTPVLKNFTFAPPNRTYTNLISNQENQNFTGTKNSLKISGFVQSCVTNVYDGVSVTTCSLGLSGVTVTLSGAANASTTTDNNGKFSFYNLGAGSYTVTASRASFTISPPSRNVVLTTTDSNLVTFSAQNPFSDRVVFTAGRVLKAMNADGSAIVTLLSGNNASPSINAGNATKLVLSRLNGAAATTREIFTADFDGGNLVARTNNGVEDANPIWLPGQNKIAFLRRPSSTATTFELFGMNPDGTNQARVISGAALSPTEFLNRIAFARPSGSTE